ncbi:hypothetical protein RHMOL_Rhmol06G0082900 [Rhododendron molle]|uniref:Uncharacterized protein n=1 Tax=Rhododendron molle TaxID=49168 RepID=A0ACC0NAX4_RHOML|nr:hypothetical protein RHMOL_Rhmol06G0082900 [Rhododendron molle]
MSSICFYRGERGVSTNYQQEKRNLTRWPVFVSRILKTTTTSLFRCGKLDLILGPTDFRGSMVQYCYAHWGCASSQIPYRLSVLPYIGGHSLDEFQSICSTYMPLGKYDFGLIVGTFVFSSRERAHDGLGFYGKSMHRSSFAPSLLKNLRQLHRMPSVAEGESTGFLCLVSFKGDGPHQNNQSRSMTGNHHLYL